MVEIDSHSDPDLAKRKVQERMDALLREADPVEDAAGGLVGDTDEFSVHDSAYLDSIGVTNPESLITESLELRPRRPQGRRRELPATRPVPQEDDWNSPDQQLSTGAMTTGRYEQPRGGSPSVDNTGWATAPPPQPLRYDSEPASTQGTSQAMPIKRNREPEAERIETAPQGNTRIETSSPFESNQAEVVWNGKEDISNGVDPRYRESEGRMNVPVPPGAVRKTYTRRSLDANAGRGLIEPDKIVVSEGTNVRPRQRVHSLSDLRGGKRRPRPQNSKPTPQQTQPQQRPQQTRSATEPLPQAFPGSEPTRKQKPKIANVEQEELW